MQKTGTPRTSSTLLDPAPDPSVGSASRATKPMPAPTEPPYAAMPGAPRIVLTERLCHADPDFRAHAQDKLSKVGKFDGKASRVDVEVSREPNPRLAGVAYRVELTVSGRGPIVRAEACAAEPVVALDLAWHKLQLRLRRSHQRRVAHTLRRSAPGGAGRRNGREVVQLGSTSALPDGSTVLSDGALPDPPTSTNRPTDAVTGVSPETTETWVQDGDGPFLLREKTHAAPPMSLDQALCEMELVGHDFFLFVDGASGQPCVLYRRRGYSYGLIRLDVSA